MLRRWEAFRMWMSRHRRFALLFQALAGVVIGGGLAYLVFTDLKWGKVWQAYQGLSFFTLLGALGVFFIALFLRAVRWRFLFLKERISSWRLFQVQNAGIGLNNFVPIRVASEPAQLFLLTVRDRISAGTALATLIMERTLDALATLLLLGVGIVLLPQLGGIVGFGPQMGFVALMTSFWVGGVRFFSWGSQRLKWFRKLPLLYTFGIGLSNLERCWPRTLISFLLTVCFWVLQGVSAWVLGKGMGLSVSLASMVVVVIGGIILTTTLPGLPAGLGTFEFAIVYLLSLFGVGKEEALSLAFLLHALLFLPSILIASIVLPREGYKGLRSLFSIESNHSPVANITNLKKQ